ncbi:polyphenol oxidase family protein [Psychrobacter sp. M13]|uniref:polyphenol oxidase family protein n=1 Tax=Psychrobacter sp. M13 TaxID=3067275 RepID=UPI00273BE6EF|nr:polyphenol oxidase family protein [Psychrobacter sp. M13]WLP93436.1 polyphenol oxidase family protein [Psychrobacter sp. M13]
MNNLPASSDSTQTMPLSVVAQFDEVTVYQTSALVIDAVDSGQDDSEQNDSKKNDSEQHRSNMLQTGQSSYGKLNLGLHVQDNAEVVLQNRMDLLGTINQQLELAQTALPNSTIKIPAIKSLHWVNQVHGQKIHDIDASRLSMQPLDADALVSRQSGVGLAIMTADCVPIVLYQPATHQIAAIHAGWQGLACGVIKATAERFDNKSPIMAWVGVCISQENYEVGSEVADKLLAGCTDNQLLSSAQLHNFTQLFCLKSDKEDRCNSDDKLRLDLPKLAIAQLQALSITLLNESAIDCSYDDSRYYSYRRQTHLQQSMTGRMALIIVHHDPIENRMSKS